MNIETALDRLLSTTATVTALAGTRIYPNVLPQGSTLPALVYSKVSGARIQHLQGPAGRARSRVTIVCWGTTYAAAKGLADVVRRALDGYQGIISSGGSPVETMQTTILIANEIDDFDDSTKFFRDILDFIVNHAET